MPASFNMNQKRSVNVEYRSNTGDLEDIQDMPVFESSDPAVFTFDPPTHVEKGKYSAFAISQGIGNDVGFTVSADGDLGEGVMMLSASDTITITTAGASTVSMSFGDPVPK